MKAIPRLIAVWILLLAAVGALRLLTVVRGEVGYTDALGLPFTAPPYDHVATATALALLLLGAWLSGRVFKLLNLPRITGYLAFGILIGPSLAALISRDAPPLLSNAQMGHLRMFSSLAIALIGLTAGGEIKVDLLRRGLARVLTITTIEMMFVFAALLTLLYFAGRRVDFLSQLHSRELLVASVMVAAVAIANSPAVLVAMLSETRAQGPMAETALAVTVCKDLLVVMLFTVAGGLGYGMLRADEGAALDASLYAELAWHLLGSIGIGAAIGAIVSTFVDRLGRHTPLFVLGTSLGIVLVSESLRLEPLLVALTAGFMLANIWPGKSESLFHSIESLSLPVFCIFFAIAGAKIDLHAVLLLWPVAVAIVVVRCAAIWSGTTLACRLTGVPAPARAWLWTALIPQAGVSIALATSAGALFAEFEWGPRLTSLLLASIALFESFGPILLRLGLIHAGETKG